MGVFSIPALLVKEGRKKNTIILYKKLSERIFMETMK